MDLGNVMAKTMLCVAMLMVGCAEESDALEEANEANEANELMGCIIGIREWSLGII